MQTFQVSCKHEALHKNWCNIIWNEKNILKSVFWLDKKASISYLFSLLLIFQILWSFFVFCFALNSFSHTVYIFTLFSPEIYRSRHLKEDSRFFKFSYFFVFVKSKLIHLSYNTSFETFSFLVLTTLINFSTIHSSFYSLKVIIWI